MNRIAIFLVALSLVAACDNGGSNPFDGEEETEGEDTAAGGEEDSPPIESGFERPPGTANPTPNTAIVRVEPADDEGGGVASSFAYNSDDDTFFVDGLAFDGGDNIYTRGGTATSVNALGSIGPFAVYESPETTTDPVTGNEVGTFTYRALYGQSTSGQTEFAIVRTGSYIDYGFGGFIYQRNQTDANGDTIRLVLPPSGDAEYRGDYAGVVVFDGAQGLNYTSGQAQMIVDFKDFNDGQNGVALFIDERRIYNINGEDITDAYLTAIENNSGGGGGIGGLLGGGEETTTKQIVVVRDAEGNPLLPGINPVISPNSSDTNGEIVGDLQSIARFEDGTTETVGEGKYYAVMSGTNAEEIVGVIAITGDDPRGSGVTYQETGGFIVYRQ